MNALARHTIHRLAARCIELEAALAAAKTVNAHLKGEAS